MASSMETIQISAALRQIFSRAWEAWISIGRTMALYLGQERGKLLKESHPRADSELIVSASLNAAPKLVAHLILARL